MTIRDMFRRDWKFPRLFMLGDRCDGVCLLLSYGTSRASAVPKSTVRGAESGMSAPSWRLERVFVYASLNNNLIFTQDPSLLTCA